MPKRRKLKNISEIRRYFHRFEEPVYFVSATNFNLLGLSTSGVKNLSYISYIDCYDGQHPNVFCPPNSRMPSSSRSRTSTTTCCSTTVIDHVARRGGKPKFIFLMFDEQTEALSKEIGAEVWFPPASLRNRIDNKIETIAHRQQGRRAQRAQHTVRDQ